MNLLLFFALPLATILLAIVIEKILNCPILVAITFFASYLIAAFALYATGVITNLAGALIAVIVYTKRPQKLCSCGSLLVETKRIELSTS